MTAEGAPEPELEIIDLTGELSEDEDEADGRGNGPESSDGNESENASRAQLHAAIYAVPEARLRHVLTQLVDTVPAVERALSKELVTVNRTTRVVIPRWEKCGNCGETFDVNEAADEPCTFHPGNLEVNEDAFADWDERCHGPMDSLETREEYPENFSWSCCEGDGLTDGCEEGRHKVAVSKKRRL
ncbi:hypothetical protein C8J57DRAFT_1288501 [Mycena rebaudengoi]|nr:hypothetical protein C8J57DRAFT_1288501 [Mycena rebaudengoi]